MNNTGILTVVSGFSGAGKGTVMKSLMKKQEYSLSISATTRLPRPGEVHGREYFFLTREEFESMIEKGQLVEWAEYVGNYYGTPRSYVEEQLSQGKNVILEIEIQGALNIKKQFPDALLLFIAPPSAAELKKRLISRASEDMDKIEKRLSRAYEEAAYMDCYDYIIVNKELTACVDTIHDIIKSEGLKTSRRSDFMKEITKDLMQFQKGE